MARGRATASGTCEGAGRITREGIVTGSRMRIVRSALLLVGVALLLVVLVPAGSATPPQTVRKFEVCIQNGGTLLPSCTAFGSHSLFTGGVHAGSARITITNDSTSTVNIGSANVTAPDQIRPETTGLPANVTVSGQVIQLRSVSIRPGRSLAFSVPVDTACSAPTSTIAWSSAADSSSGFTGTGAFAYQSALSTGDTTELSTGCHLGFVNQPTDTQTGSAITDSGGSGGNAIQVGLFTGASGTTAMTACPYGDGNCSVTLDRTPADGTATNFGSKALSADGAALTATFTGASLSNIATANLPESFQLTATGDTNLAPTVYSNSFLITLYAQSCTNGACSLLHKQLPGNGNVDSFADLSTASGFSFTTLSPFAVSTVPAGCANFTSLGVQGFTETDGRTPGGHLIITYYVSMNKIKARYGKNVGQQFIPICAGAKPVDPVTHTAHNCTAGDTWQGDELGANGNFDGKSAAAVCDADGYVYGIMSSFQDKLDASVNPTVTGWGSQTINGVNYRGFTIDVPPNWDYRGNG